MRTISRAANVPAHDKGRTESRGGSGADAPAGGGDAAEGASGAPREAEGPKAARKGAKSASESGSSNGGGAGGATDSDGPSTASVLGIGANARTSGSSNDGPSNDGPSVRREPKSKAELEELDPQLEGKLDPPVADEPPEGVDVREDEDGTRVVTINIHQAVAGGDELDVDNQDIDALRDVAAWVNAADPDVVLVQEVRDQEPQPGDEEEEDGVAHQASVLYHLLDADDMAFTPALGHEGYSADDSREYGTAIYTRNGYTIDQAHNVDLPNDSGGIEDRSAGVALISSPEGEQSVVVNAHLSANNTVDGERQDQGDLRRDQLEVLAGVVEQIREDGSFTYRDAISEDDETATGFPSDVPIIVGGDLNAKRRSGPDDILGDAGLTNGAGDQDSVGGYHYGAFPHRNEIDHLFSDGLDIDSYAVAELDRIELEERDPNDPDSDLDSVTPTDHPLVVVDYTRAG